MSIKDKKGINVTSGFKLVAPTPIDARFIAEDETDLQSLIDNGAIYNGLVVWVNSTSKQMIYNGTAFVEVASGGTSSGGSSTGGSETTLITCNDLIAVLETTESTTGTLSDNDYNAIVEAINSGLTITGITGVIEEVITMTMPVRAYANGMFLVGDSHTYNSDKQAIEATLLTIDIAKKTYAIEVGEVGGGSSGSGLTLLHENTITTGARTSESTQPADIEITSDVSFFDSYDWANIKKITIEGLLMGMVNCHCECDFSYGGGDMDGVYTFMGYLRFNHPIDHNCWNMNINITIQDHTNVVQKSFTVMSNSVDNSNFDADIFANTTLTIKAYTY